MERNGRFSLGDDKINATLPRERTEIF